MRFHLAHDKETVGFEPLPAVRGQRKLGIVVVWRANLPEKVAGFGRPKQVDAGCGDQGDDAAEPFHLSPKTLATVARQQRALLARSHSPTEVLDSVWQKRRTPKKPQPPDMFPSRLSSESSPPHQSGRRSIR